jgi:hypothetical protein
MSLMIRSKRTSIAITISLVIAMTATAHLKASDADDDAAQKTASLVATADFNGDGVADVAEVKVAGGEKKGPGVLIVLLGQKNGSYIAARGQTILGDDPKAIAAGDFNRDGKADLMVADGDGSVVELLGDGKGNFAIASKAAQVGSAVSITVGDFNHDGIPDFAVSDFSANAVTIFLGSGRGAFRPAWSFPLPMRGTVYYLAAADFNGDGVSDLAISSDEENTFVVMLGNGNGTFTYAPALSHMKDPNSYCPA